MSPMVYPWVVIGKSLSPNLTDFQYFSNKFNILRFYRLEYLMIRRVLVFGETPCAFSKLCAHSRLTTEVHYALLANYLVKLFIFGVGICFNLRIATNELPWPNF